MFLFFMLYLHTLLVVLYVTTFSYICCHSQIQTNVWYECFFVLYEYPTKITVVVFLLNVVD
jgi:hypothetical protein